MTKFLSLDGIKERSRCAFSVRAVTTRTRLPLFAASIAANMSPIDLLWLGIKILSLESIWLVL